jgi:hypothetical protein
MTNFVAFARFAFLIGVSGVVLSAQIPTDSWPTYHGDYTGRRYSTLKQINTTNVKGLTLAWVYRVNTSRAGAIVGGPDTPSAAGAPQVKSTPLMINGTLYFSVPDHVYAVDARTGRDVWHFAWKTRGGDHIGNRGVGILDNWLYFLTPDNYFVSLDVATGKERWHHEIANMKREYFSTNAPMIIGRQVIIGVGGDALDIPGYLESRDPEKGDLVWRSRTQPLLSRHRQSAARARRQEPARRQPLHLHDRRAQPDHRQDGVALPGHAARYARLGRRADADPDRW